MFVFNIKRLVMFPLKSNYCDKIFKSIQVVLNVWEQFEVQNPDILGLQWISASYFYFIQCLFSILKDLNVAQTSLFYMSKISFQSKKLWVTEKHFSRRKFSLRCIFATILTFESYFASSMNQFNDIFLHQYVCILVLNYFIVKVFSFE